MEINYIRSSQIMPVSAFDTQLNITDLYRQFEQHFFSKGQVAYKVFKNAYTSSLPDSLSKTHFIQSLFNALEGAIKLQVRESQTNAQEASIATKEAFEIVTNVFKILEKQNLQIEPFVLYAALVGFILAKSKK